MQERKKFVVNPRYFKMQTASKASAIVNRVTGDKQISDIKQELREQPSLVIFDDMDALLDNQWEAYRQIINEFFDYTKICFIITLANKDILKKNGRKIGPFESIIEIPPLSSDMAAKLLIMLAENELNFSERNPYNLQENDLLKSKLPAKDVITIANQVKAGKSLKEIAHQKTLDE